MRGLSAVGRAWSALWFREESTLSLDLIRIGLGACFLASYVGVTPLLHELWGDSGWLPREALALYVGSWEFQSLHYHFTAPWQWAAFHAVFLLACLAFTIGCGTRWAKWIVLVGHVSYAYRNPMITYGVDTILASATFLVCLAPIGSTLSVDRWLVRRRATRLGVNAPLPPVSPFHFTVRRLLQIQVALVMFFAGIEKLRGDWWWSGDALWVALLNYEFMNVPPDWLAAAYPVVNLLTYGTLLLEIAFPFLVWQRATRPFVLPAAAAMHLGIAVLMGLYLFSAAMLVCDLAFVRSAWLDAVARRVRPMRWAPLPTRRATPTAAWSGGDLAARADRAPS